LTDGRDTSLKGPDDSAIVSAIESFAEPEFEAFVRTIDDPALAGRVCMMRTDRGLMARLGELAEPAPVGILAAAIDEGLGELDESVLARLGEGPALCDGLPVSAIEPYHETLSLRFWNHRREIGMLAAAGLVFVAGIGIVTGVWALRAPRTPERLAEVETEAIENNAMADVGVETDKSESDLKSEPGFSIAAGPAFESDSVERVESVFDATELLSTGRLYVYARAGSADRTDAAMRALADRSIEDEQSFVIRDSGALGDGVLALLGLPDLDAPMIAAEEGIGATLIPVRSGWAAEVERSPTSLAALRKRLEEAGMVVEFRVADDPVAMPAEIRADDVLWWSSPPSAWKRSTAIPVVIDSLPD